MSPTPNSYLVIALRMLFGIFILFLGYRMIRFELGLKRYEHDFLQIEHPEGTTRVHSFGLELDYYPATYVDDSIPFPSAFLVGELRSYRGNWDDLKTFYSDKRFEVGSSNPLFIEVLPVEMDMDGEKNWLDFPPDFSYDPFQADILSELQSYCRSKKIPRIQIDKNLYLVYIAPDL
jgi:hypothetical protein